MDPRDRADAMLARARARRTGIVTPDDAVSPMDAASTQQLPRAVVSAADQPPDEERTTSIPPPQRDPGVTGDGRTRPMPHPRATSREQPGLQEQPVDGLLPTVQRQAGNTRSLSQRLSGE